MLLMLLAASIPPFAHAHKSSDSYLNLRVAEGRLSGQWDIALRDLEPAIGLDENDDGVITWGELLSRKEAVSAYALSRLHVLADGAPVALGVGELLVDTHSDGQYAVLRLWKDEARCVSTLQITYDAFFDIDPKHRGLFRLEH